MPTSPHDALTAATRAVKALGPDYPAQVSVTFDNLTRDTIITVTGLTDHGPHAINEATAREVLASEGVTDPFVQMCGPETYLAGIHPHGAVMRVQLAPVDPS